MNPVTFKNALQRLSRAWREAAFILSQRGPREHRKLTKATKAKNAAALLANDVFNKLDGNPCIDCKRCCSNGAFSLGFHTHREREALLQKGFDFSAYLVKSWTEPAEEPASRCLFLSSEGCNLPVQARSNQCLSYVCYDRLGPALVANQLTKEYDVSVKRLQRVSKKLRKLSRPAFSPETRDFGASCQN